MANIIDYLKKYGNLSFQEEKFNELDAAIFSRLSYIDYSSLINSRKYHDLMKVEDGTFTEDIEEVDYNEIPLLDKRNDRLISVCLILDIIL